MLSSFAGILRLASVIICVITVASFAIFAVNQTDHASHHQQEVVSSPTGQALAPASAPPTGTQHESTVRRVIDEASNKLTSPFSSITVGSSSEWGTRGLNLLLALVVYGFGLGFLARVIRVRV